MNDEKRWAIRSKRRFRDFFIKSYWLASFTRHAWEWEIFDLKAKWIGPFQSVEDANAFYDVMMK